jgi:ATP-dependent RNA helicase RhlB
VNAPRAIVIAPTRELAVQIHSDAEGIGKYTGLKLAIVFGGVDYEKQRRILEEGVDVLIGTPGRIIDYFKQHVFDLRHIKSRSWTKPIACSIWASSRISASFCGACRTRRCA